MTDAITTALGDLDTAVSGITGEMSTLVAQVQQLQQQIANGQPSAALAAEIETRATTLHDALTSAQTALASTASGTPTSPATTVGTGTPTDVSTPSSTPVDNPPDPNAAATGTNTAQGGSPMG